MKNSDLRSIIDFAIANEMESYEFYKNAALKSKDGDLKDIFENLAREELEHREFLRNFLASSVDEIKIDKLPDYNIAKTIDKPKLSVDMSFADAIGLAIKYEEEAMDMYNNLARACHDKEQKELFLGLMNMEQMHKSKLEEIYVNVGYAEIW